MGLVVERQRLQQDGVHDREETDSQSEPEGKGERRREKEAGLPAQAAERVAQVLAALIHAAEEARRSVVHAVW